MDKRTAIEWLTGFICEEDGADREATAELLSADVDIPLADATKITAECEELLKAMFAAWLADTAEEIDEDACTPNKPDADGATPAEEPKTTETEKLNTDISPDA